MTSPVSVYRFIFSTFGTWTDVLCEDHAGAGGSFERMETVGLSGLPCRRCDDVQAARKAYRNAIRGLTYDNATREEVNAEIRTTVAANATPAQWVAAAETCQMKCRRCAGTGLFVTYVENGQAKGPGGECYRCGGHGVQTAEDGHRNRGSDRHQFALAVQSMMGSRA